MGMTLSGPDDLPEFRKRCSMIENESESTYEEAILATGKIEDSTFLLDDTLRASTSAEHICTEMNYRESL